jgi:hypothetical protein
MSQSFDLRIDMSYWVSCRTYVLMKVCACSSLRSGWWWVLGTLFGCGGGDGDESVNSWGIR